MLKVDTLTLTLKGEGINGLALFPKAEGKNG
jgi:hypothetical protein